jgi:hypothetical protein
MILSLEIGPKPVLVISDQCVCVCWFFTASKSKSYTHRYVAHLHPVQITYSDCFQSPHLNLNFPPLVLSFSLRLTPLNQSWLAGKLPYFMGLEFHQKIIKLNGYSCGRSWNIQRDTYKLDFGKPLPLSH